MSERHSTPGCTAARGEHHAGVLLLETIVLCDRATPGHVLEAVASRTSSDHARGLLLAHPGTPTDACVGLVVEDAQAVAFAIASPVATPATRDRVLAAATDSALRVVAGRRLARNHGPAIAATLAIRGLSDLVHPADLQRMRRPAPARCDPDRGIAPDCAPRRLQAVAHWRAMLGKHSTIHDGLAARSLARLSVHPSTPASARAPLLRSLRRLVVGRNPGPLERAHIAYTLVLDPDLNRLLRTRPMHQVQAWARADVDVAYGLACLAAPLVSDLWANRDVTHTALALEETFTGTLPDLLATARTVAG